MAAFTFVVLIISDRVGLYDIFIDVDELVDSNHDIMTFISSIARCDHHSPQILSVSMYLSISLLPNVLFMRNILYC